jgi:hypothetical protein
MAISHLLGLRNSSGAHAENSSSLSAQQEGAPAECASRTEAGGASCSRAKALNTFKQHSPQHLLQEVLK